MLAAAAQRPEARPSLIGLDLAGWKRAWPRLGEPEAWTAPAGAPAVPLDLPSRCGRPSQTMTTLPRDLRGRLAEATPCRAARDRRPSSARPTARASGCCASPTGRRSRASSSRRRTAGALCVSTQVGCTLTCSFCHTGTQPLVRNLGAAEIVGADSGGARRAGEWPTRRRDGTAVHQHRHDGHGRAALQLRQRGRGAADRDGRRRAWLCRGGASRCRPRASCR